jgi:hypothetical protein
MISILVAFYILIFIFAVIGALRGWAKELLVSFSVILALALIAVFEELLPITRDLIRQGSSQQFWIRTIIVIILVVFGNQSPKLTQLSRAAARRDQIQDIILGLIFGAINGYLIFGTLWAYMDDAGYPFSPYITAPSPTDPLGETALRVVEILPPNWLGESPLIFVATVIAFVFVIVVFI